MPLCAVGLAGTADQRLCGRIYVVDRMSDVRHNRLETVIAAPAADCFDLSLSVDAHTHSMAGSGERAIAGVTSGAMKLGDTVTWRARHFGTTFRMTSAITEYQRPIRFVDEQRRGPFRRWCHEHTFRPVPDGKTLTVDVVEFRSPLGWLAALVDRLVLARYMNHLVRQRNAWRKEALESVDGDVNQLPSG
jgi:ligand-binding SRPBCC domain-containing protein